jgi:acetyl esterase/lipase
MRGFAAWNIEYRRVGETGGGWPGTFQDVAAAADALLKLSPVYPLELNQVVAIGHSAGGHLGLWLGARHRLPASEITVGSTPLHLRGVISLAGVNDLEHAWQLHLGNNATEALMGGSPAAYPLRYQLASPAAQLPLDLPQTLIHGSADDNVPLVISQQYAAHAEQAGDTVHLIELAGADHFVLIDPISDAWQVTIREIQALLHLL